MFFHTIQAVNAVARSGASSIGANTGLRVSVPMSGRGRSRLFSAFASAATLPYTAAAAAPAYGSGRHHAITTRSTVTTSSSVTTTTTTAESGPIFRPRRAMLYMPGNDLHKIQKSVTLGVDSICMDLEDAVAFHKKSDARNTIASALRTVDFGRSECIVRINPVGSGLENDDINAVLAVPENKWPSAIVLPKTDNADHVLWLSDTIQHQLGSSGNHIKIICLIETGMGLLNLPEIVRADPSRLAALIYGADDYAADIGAIRTQEGREVWYARNHVLLYAKAHKLQAIDMVQIHYNDENLLVRECLEGFQMGYTGKQIIHPKQVAPVQRCFSPSSTDIEKAKHIVEAYKAFDAAGTGAFTLDGKMIDMPTIKQAQAVLDRAKACGLLP